MQIVAILERRSWRFSNIHGTREFNVNTPAQIITTVVIPGNHIDAAVNKNNDSLTQAKLIHTLLSADSLTTELLPFTARITVAQLPPNSSTANKELNKTLRANQ